MFVKATQSKAEIFLFGNSINSFEKITDSILLKLHIARSSQEALRNVSLSLQQLSLRSKFKKYILFGGNVGVQYKDRSTYPGSAISIHVEGLMQLS